jgi:chemotaxis family two-component system response regulator PixG
LIGLEEVKDFPSYSVKPATATNSVFAPAANSVSSERSQSTRVTVAYIDDSRLDSQTMSHILNQAGYQFLNIQDPVKALPLLLEHKPSLIFLDLVMPIANGYEICAQIRRISAFKDTPVIILTSNDGIVDRVRAKIVGSSGFLAKPINSEKVLATLQRYLPTSTTAQSQRWNTP